MPDLSVIIPCFNSGDFLSEAIESVKAYNNSYEYEIIIVNDGSTDLNTNKVLQDFVNDGITIIHQENKGPAAARNTGVRSAKSEYILFLDSDNKVRTEYIDKGIGILNSNPDIDIVYGNANFFGDETSIPFKPQEFDLYTILSGNNIDTCTVMRKSAWKSLGEFDEERVLIGHEDWEFWIRAGKNNCRFYHINEVMFDYRISSSSLVKQALVSEKHQAMLKYLYGKHLDVFILHHQHLSSQAMFYQNDQQKPFRSFIKYFIKKYFMKPKSVTWLNSSNA